MKAIDLAKKLYPKLSREYLIRIICPDTLEICDIIDCIQDTHATECIKCWDREISQVRVDWLLEAKKIGAFLE